MLAIVRKFEAELRKKCDVVEIQTKNYLNQSDFFEQDYTYRRGFYIIPKEGGRVNKVTFGYFYLKDSFGEPNIKCFLQLDSEKDLSEYGVEIPEEFIRGEISNS